MSDGTWVLWVLAAAFGIVAWRRGRPVATEGLRLGVDRLIVTVPRIVLAILIAGFVGKLVPGEPIGRLLGPDSGMLGILLASLVGGFVPSGPVVSFPLAVVLYEAGAGTGQLVAFLTAWSIFAFHRVITYEIPLMGWRFSAMRLLSCLFLPPLSGLLAAGLQQLF